MNRDLIKLKILQIAVDALLVFSAFMLAYFLRVGFIFSTDFPFGKYVSIAAITVPVTLVFMFFARAYKLTQQVNSWRHVERVAFVAIENVAVFIVLYYFAFRQFFSRMILVYIFVFTFVLVYLWHQLFRWILQKSSEREIGVYRTLVIGANRPAEEIIKRLVLAQSHLKPVAIIDASGTGKTIIAGVPVVGKMDMFERAIAAHRIDHILQTDALQNNIKYVMTPELLGIFQGHQTMEEIEGQMFLKVHRKKKWWEQIW
jgi:FlaA1/EpsC-like NDP-sugar epimerase